MSEDDRHYLGTDLTKTAAKKAALANGLRGPGFIQGFLECRSRYRKIENNMREWMEVKDKALDLLHKTYTDDTAELRAENERLRETLKSWLKAHGDSDGRYQHGFLIHLTEEALKQERRKAFDAGCITGAKMVYCDDLSHRMEVRENDFRAYEQERKKEDEREN